MVTFGRLLCVLGWILAWHCLVAVPLFAENSCLRIITTVPPLYSFAANVAGGRAQVQPLLPPSVGPHDVQFAPGDLRKISQADLIVLAGIGLESWLEKPLAQVPGAREKLVVASEGLKENLIHGVSPIRDGAGSEPAPAEAQSINPHFWLDPTLAARAIRNIVAALQRLDPAHRDEFDRNAKRYLAALESLDREYQMKLRPLQDRGFVTYHDAFAYLVKRYALNLVGVVEQTPEVEPSFHYLRELLQAMRHRHARAIFIEPQFSPKLARQIAQDLKIRLAELDPLETGVSTPEGYLEGMKRNLGALEENLK